MKFILKTMWGEKQRLYGVLFEQIFVFIILIFCLNFLINSIEKYYESSRIDVKNIIMFASLGEIKDIKNSETELNVIIENLSSCTFVDGITNTFNFAPYLRNENMYYNDSIVLSEGIKIRTFIKAADEKSKKIFNLNILQGDWLSTPRLKNNNIAVVVTKDFVTVSGIQSSPIGKTFKYHNETCQIVGVLDHLKHHISTKPIPAVIMHPDIMSQFAGDYFYTEQYIKIRSGYEFECYNYINKEYKRLLGDKNVIPIITSLEQLKKTELVNTFLGVILFCIPSLFLFLFSLIGTIGVTIVNYKRRLKEFAIKIAIGASKKEIIKMFIIESFIITSIAFIPSVIIYLISVGNNFTIKDMLLLLIMLILAILFSISSACVPISKILKISPAETLKKE